jgi:hypothetical protein
VGRNDAIQGNEEMWASEDGVPVETNQAHIGNKYQHLFGT